MIGDKNAVLIASRILAYGKEYKVQHLGRDVTVDLTKLKEYINVLENEIIELKKEKTKLNDHEFEKVKKELDEKIDSICF